MYGFLAELISISCKLYSVFEISKDLPSLATTFAGASGAA